MSDLEMSQSLQFNLCISVDAGPGNGEPGSGDGYAWANSKKRELFKEDLEQSHHFTVYLDKLAKYLPDVYTNKFSDNSQFIPVKSINFIETSISNMSLPVGVLGDLPVTQRKSLGRISLTLYDNDKEVIERSIRAWIDECFPKNIYVGYLDEIVGRLDYKSYGVTGKLNKGTTTTFYVLPSDSLAINRGYDDNGAKLIDFSVAIVGVDTN